MAASDANASAGGKVSDHLANERTFLAWIRTAISVIVFGFVVAKFGITLRELLRTQGGANQPASGVSLDIGIGFMAMGIFMALAALNRYRSTRRRLEAGSFEPAGAIVVILAWVAAGFGAILAAYLIFTAHSV